MSTLAMTLVIAPEPPRRDAGERSAVQSVTERAVLRVTLTREEAAACLGIGVRTLQDWTRDGFIPSIRRGGIRLYSVDALRAWAKDASEYDGPGEVSRGKASALGNGIGVSAQWGRPLGGRRVRAPTPLRKDRAGGAPDAG